MVLLHLFLLCIDPRKFNDEQIPVRTFNGFLQGLFPIQACGEDLRPTVDNGCLTAVAFLDL